MTKKLTDHEAMLHWQALAKQEKARAAELEERLHRTVEERDELAAHLHDARYIRP